LQVSMPGLDPMSLLAFGQALTPLRDEGVLIIGSGFLTHNLRLGPMSSTPSWAAEFDAWATDVLARRDIDALLDYRARAPGVGMALPTHEHFVPVIVSAGAAVDDSAAVKFPITGFWFGSFTKRSVQFG
jgi:4,5-DOPA dioxygenase extradiol